MALSLEWTKNLRDQKSKSDFEQVLRASTMVTQRLYELCDEWEEELTRKDTKEADFDTPNWETRQAYRLGDKSRIRKLRDLLSFLQENSNV
jgi:hypothetical protein